MGEVVSDLRQNLNFYLGATDKLKVHMTEKSSFLRKFTLNGLNGYKTVTLNCESSTKIVNGDNGSGKTSLLNALYAVLAGKKSLLYAINF